jgi:serine/threonine protein phosphatase PrpC
MGPKENGRKIVMANAGDSRAIVAYEDQGRMKVKELRYVSVKRDLI